MSVIPWKSSWWCATLATSSMLVPEFHPPGRFHGVSTQSTSSTLPLWGLCSCQGATCYWLCDKWALWVLWQWYNLTVLIQCQCFPQLSLDKYREGTVGSKEYYFLFFLLSPLLAPLPLPGHLLEIVAMCFGPWSGLWLVQLGVVSLIWCSQW